jgi:hypothetical protein
MNIIHNKKREPKIKITKSIQEKLDKTDDTDKKKKPFIPKEKVNIEEDFLNMIGEENFYGEEITNKKTINKNRSKKKVVSKKGESLNNFLYLLIGIIGFLIFIVSIWKMTS